MARTVMARQGASWRGRLGKVRLVGLRYGEVRRVTAWQAWCGKARQGQAGFGKSRQAWFGAAGHGMTWQAWLGAVCRGAAWHGKAGVAVHGSVGFVGVRRGKSWQACHGKAE